LPPRLMMAIIEYSSLHEEARQDILGRNAGRLMGLPVDHSS
jgi:hypothetical protein